MNAGRPTRSSRSQRGRGTTMRAFEVTDPGGLDRLRRVDLPPPTPPAGHALVRTVTAGLNFSDLLMIRGAYQVRPPFPFVPGQEVTGTVVVADPDDTLPVGTRVASKVVWGGFAELVPVRVDMAIPLPDDVDFVEATALPVVYPTAHIALHARARVQVGETVLVHAAAGAVGLAAVQVAKAAGARVIATAGGPDKLAFCQGHGADVTVDYRAQAWDERVRELTGGRGVDVVFDPVGGHVTETSLRCLAPGGRLLIVGFASGSIPRIPANRLLLRSAAAIGVYWSHDRPDDRPVLEEALADLLRLHRKEALRFVVTRTYPFEELPRALDDLAGRRTTGKVALVCAE